MKGRKGKIVAICGIDGAGKTELLENIRQKISNNKQVICTYSYGTPVFTEELNRVGKEVGKSRRNLFSRKLRAMVWANDFLYRYYNYFYPQCSVGNVIILDRYFISSIVHAELIHEEEFVKYIKNIFSKIEKPDLVLYLRITPEKARERIEKRNTEKVPYENLENLIKMEQVYAKIIEEGEYNIRVINAEKSQVEITNEALKIIEGEIDIHI